MSTHKSEHTATGGRCVWHAGKGVCQMRRMSGSFLQNLPFVSFPSEHLLRTPTNIVPLRRTSTCYPSPWCKRLPLPGLVTPGFSGSFASFCPQDLRSSLAFHTDQLKSTPVTRNDWGRFWRCVAHICQLRLVFMWSVKPPPVSSSPGFSNVAVAFWSHTQESGTARHVGHLCWFCCFLLVFIGLRTLLIWWSIASKFVMATQLFPCPLLVAEEAGDDTCWADAAVGQPWLLGVLILWVGHEK